MNSTSNVKCNLKLSYLYYQEVGKQRRTKDIGCFFCFMVSVVNAIKAIFSRAVVPMSELEKMVESKDKNSPLAMQIQKIRSRNIEVVPSEKNILLCGPYDKGRLNTQNLLEGGIKEQHEKAKVKPQVKKKPILVANVSNGINTAMIKNVQANDVDFIKGVLAGHEPISSISEQWGPVWNHGEIRLIMKENGDLYMGKVGDRGLTSVEKPVAFKAESDSGNLVIGDHASKEWKVKIGNGESYVIHNGFLRLEAPRTRSESLTRSTEELPQNFQNAVENIRDVDFLSAINKTKLKLKTYDGKEIVEPQDDAKSFATIMCSKMEEKNVFNIIYDDELSSINNIWSD